MKLESIAERMPIVSDGEFVVLYGSTLWIYKVDGTFVAHRADLQNVRAILFLPNKTMFVDGGENAYHLVSLADGVEIWKHTYPRPMEYPSGRLVASKDHRFVYTYYEWRNHSYLVSVDLKLKEIHVQRDSYNQYVTEDIACDETDKPCLLKSVYIEQNGARVGECGVVRLDHTGALSKPNKNWIHKWQYHDSQFAFRFFSCTNEVITNNLFIHNLITGEQYYLLENEHNWIPPRQNPSDCWADVTGSYLTFKFLNENVIVDIKKRTVVAVYPGKFFWGCIIGNEFWMSIGQGVERKPFPSVNLTE